MKHLFRILFCILFLLTVLFSANGENETKDTITTWYPKNFNIQLSWIPEAHVPYSAERLTMLSDLMKHLSLRLKNRSNENTLSILLDNDPFFVSTEIHQNGIQSLILSIDPFHLYESADNGHSMLAEILEIETPITSLAGIDANEPVILYGIKNILNQLPWLFHDRLKEEKVRSNLGKFGTVVKKETLVFDGDEDIIQLATGGANSIISQWVDKLRFSGKQTIVWFYNETGDCVKTTYSGKCGIEEDLRNVSLNWRSIQSESGIIEELLIKSPGTKTGNRNNLLFSQESVICNEETLTSISFSLDKVYNKHRNLISGELSWKENGDESSSYVSCNAELTQTDSEGVKTFLKLEPILTFSDENIKGTLGYSFGHEKNKIEEKGTICFEIFDDNEDSYSLSDENRITVNWEEETRNSLLSKFAIVFLRKIMELPDEDLSFVSRDLTDLQWESIKKIYRETNIDH